jgi:hypothetical protein
VQDGYGACFCNPGTNFIELWVRSRYKFYKLLKISHGSRTLVNGHMRSIAVQVVRKPEIGHGIEFNLRADARVQMHKPVRNCHGSRRKSKNHDK